METWKMPSHHHQSFLTQQTCLSQQQSAVPQLLAPKVQPSMMSLSQTVSLGITVQMAHCRTITFTATIKSTNSDLAPPIPSHTNKKYTFSNTIVVLYCAKTVPLSGSLMRGCFDMEEHIAEKGSDTESMLAQNEDAKTEVDRDADCSKYPDDTISKTNCDIGFPPPIPRDRFFCIQNFDSSDCNTGNNTVIPNPSYMGVHKATV